MGELVVRRNGGRYDGSYESLGTTMTARKFLKFVVVSPRDTAIECAAAFDVAEDLNDGIAAERGLYLDDWWWPKAYPGPDPEGGQGHLDKLMKIDQADLVIGIFSRLYGTVLPDGYSGTEHELRKAIAAWEQTRQPHVMVYFNTDPGVPRAGRYRREREAHRRLSRVRHTEGSLRRLCRCGAFRSQGSKRPDAMVA